MGSMTDPYDLLRKFVAAYKGDAIADSDLDDEQPRTITVTLGDIRRAERAIGAHEHNDPLLTAIRQFAECDLNDSNCASLEVATRRIRNLANRALAQAGAAK